MPSSMCAWKCQSVPDTSAAFGCISTMPCRYSARRSMVCGSFTWCSDAGSVDRPMTSCTHRMTRMAMSVRWLVRRMRGSNSRRCSSMVNPMKHSPPAMPPATTAINCFCEAVTKISYSQCGVSCPNRWPKNRNRMPPWNRLLPQRSCALRSSCELSLFQVYWSRSKRARLPIRKTARQRYG